MRELLVATRSSGKIREIRRILTAVPGLRVLDLEQAGIPFDSAEDGLERFDTFEANARAKAEHFHRLSGLPTVADDSGLEVDALGGGPGVRTKRFAPAEDLEGQELDDANNAYLIERLRGVPDPDRGARYVCVCVLVPEDGGPPRAFRGAAEGRIAHVPAGHGGFGYDPYFLDPELGRTFAELDPAQKDRRSHRGKAFRALAAELAKGAGT